MKEFEIGFLKKKKIKANDLLFKKLEKLSVVLKVVCHPL